MLFYWELVYMLFVHSMYFCWQVYSLFCHTVFSLQTDAALSRLVMIAGCSILSIFGSQFVGLPGAGITGVLVMLLIAPIRWRKRGWTLHSVSEGFSSQCSGCLKFSTSFLTDISCTKWFFGKTQFCQFVCSWDNYKQFQLWIYSIFTW